MRIKHASSSIKRASAKPIVFLKRSPWTRPYRDCNRDSREDARILRRLAMQRGGVLKTKAPEDLVEIALSANMPYGNVDSGLDTATFTGLGRPIPGKGMYQFFQESD